MNSKHDGTPLDAHDWRAQEDALAAPGNRRDALLARALATMPVSQPPPGFAADVARLAATGTQAGVAAEPAFERVLLKMLVAVFALAALVVVVLYAGQWLAQLRGAFGDGAATWLLAVIACTGVSWAIGGIRGALEGAGQGLARSR